MVAMNLRTPLLSSAAIATFAGLTLFAQSARTPQAAVDELLAADRAFSTASARVDLIAGLSAMFAPDVTMPAPPGRFAESATQAADALRANPDNPPSKIEWTPVRGGVSADGQHGFTLGFMTWHRADGMDVGLKYLSYWVKRPEGWRVVAYKRARRGEGPVPTTVMAPALPAALVPVTTDAAVVARHRDSLDAAERAFSRDAQTMGLGPAFVQYGSADATNMGGPMNAGFVVGADAIGLAVNGGTLTKDSPVSWGPDRVLVASSGDLGVTIGFIRANAAGPNGQPSPPAPFFTIWRRANPTAPWKYVAE
jgi:ketosteroid isomerase-like protein